MTLGSDKDKTMTLTSLTGSVVVDEQNTTGHPHGNFLVLNIQVKNRYHVTCVKHRKEGNVLFNDALNTFYLRLYGVGLMVKDHSDSERGNLLPSHGLLFPINSKGSFICTIPQTG